MHTFIIARQCKEIFLSSLDIVLVSKIDLSSTPRRIVINKDGSIRQNSAHHRLKRKIENQEAEIDELKRQTMQMPEKIDITSLKDHSCFKRICNESKNLFDFATRSVWNARMQMVGWLLPFYGNKNEYVDLFYAITSC